MTTLSRRAGFRALAAATTSSLLTACTRQASEGRALPSTRRESLSPSASSSAAASPRSGDLSVGDLLRQLADTITAEPGDAKDSHRYPYSYLRSQRWDRVTKVVARTDETWWRAADGTGRSDRRILPERRDLTRMPSPAEQRKLAAARVETDLFPDRGRLAGVVPEPVAADQTTLTGQLYETNPPENGPISLLLGVCDLARAHYLTRDVRATTLRILATIPTLVYAGPARDLVGRPAMQFHLDTGDQREAILLNPRTGRLLAHQQNILLHPPALFTHVLYLVADRVARLGDAPRPTSGSVA